MRSSRPVAWILPGIFIVGAFTLAAGVFKSSEIKNDLASRALEKLAPEHSWAKVEVDGRNITLSGTAPTEEAKQKAISLVDGALFDRDQGTWGVRAIDIANLKTLPVEKPYVTKAHFKENTLTLSGFVPSASDRDAMRSLARSHIGESQLVDDTQLAAGAPDGFLLQGDFALSQLGKLDEGSFELKDGVLSLSGTTSNKAVRQELLKASEGALPGGLKVTSFDIAPIPVSPYVFVAKKGFTELIIEGNTPDKTTQKDVALKARSKAPQEALRDFTQIDAGAPKNYQDRAGFALETLEQLTVGEARLVDDVLSVSGQVENEKARQEIIASLQEPLPFGLTIGEVTIGFPGQETGAAGTADGETKNNGGESAKTQENAQPQPVAPPALAHVFTIEKTTDGILLGGTVPSAGMRDELIAAAGKTSDLALIDNLTVGKDIPEGFAAFGPYAVDLISKLETGSISTFDKTFSLVGVAKHIIAQQEIDTLLASPPAGYEAGKIDLDDAKVSPYALSAVKNGEEIILTGNLPSAAAEESILSRAAALDAGSVVDNLEVLEGAPEGFDKAAGFAVDALSYFTEGSVVIGGTNIVIDGTAKSLDDFDAAQALSNDVPQGFTLKSLVVDPPIVSPYTWSITGVGSKVLLQGLVPNEESRREIRARVSSVNPSAKIQDNMRLADGVPSDLNWSGATGFAIELMKDLKFGTVTLDGGVLSLKGESASPEGYDKLQEKLEGAQAVGLSLGDIDLKRILVTPFTFSVEKQDDSVEITGLVSEESAIEVIRDRALRQFGDTITSFDLKIARGAPQGFENAVNVGLLSISRLSAGTLKIAGETANLEGVVPFGAPLADIEAQFKTDLPTNFKAETVLSVAALPTPVSSDVCNERILNATTNSKVFFQSGRATILSDSFGLLDGIAETVLSCPSARFRVVGHTDSDGSDKANIRLSLARAEAVIDYLARAGVKLDRLEALGLGESQPVAANDTDENKALNRRIEFKLLAE